MFKLSDFICSRPTPHESFVRKHTLPWELIKDLPNYTLELLSAHGAEKHPSATIHERALLEGAIYIGEGARIESQAIIKGPVFIGRNCHIGNNAFIRPNTILRDDASVGFNSEVKSSLILEKAAVSHFCFIGDSVVGESVLMGAKTTTANFPHAMPIVDDGSRILLRYKGIGEFDTGLRHMGSIMGDRARLGCHSVLNPGTLIGMDSVIHPNIDLKGYIPPASLVTKKESFEIRDRASLQRTPKIGNIKP